MRLPQSSHQRPGEWHAMIQRVGYTTPHCSHYSEGEDSFKKALPGNKVKLTMLIYGLGFGCRQANRTTLGALVMTLGALLQTLNYPISP
jgi:hypothetical protein